MTTYTIAANGCFLECTEVGTGKLVRQLNLATLTWTDKGDDDIALRDGDDNTFNADVDQLPAFATVPDIIAFLLPLRNACALQSGGGGIPTTSNGLPTNLTVTGAGAAATAAGLQSVAITNVGVTNGTVLGATIFPKQTINFPAYHDVFANNFVRLAAITYNADTTTLSIQTIP